MKNNYIYNVIDITKRFNDNSISNKKEIIGVFHWTGGHDAEGAIEWLDERKGGVGSVGYNYIIDRNGLIYMLAKPGSRWMHNTGLGTHFDESTISIAFAALDENDTFTDEQIESAKILIEDLQEMFDIKWTHHAKLNSHKRDFPDWFWNKLVIKLDIPKGMVL
jgi:N-acetyl-anhydromuramyl-L-alanine amidase AmpD